MKSVGHAVVVNELKPSYHITIRTAHHSAQYIYMDFMFASFYITIL